MGGLDMGSLLANPGFMRMAQNIMSNPSMMSMVQQAFGSMMVPGLGPMGPMGPAGGVGSGSDSATSGASGAGSGGVSSGGEQEGDSEHAPLEPTVESGASTGANLFATGGAGVGAGDGAVPPPDSSTPGGPADMGSFLAMGQRLAAQIQAANPELVEHMRQQFRAQQATTPAPPSATQNDPTNPLPPADQSQSQFNAPRQF